MKLSDELEALLLKLVGDNTGEGCTCEGCEDSREEMRQAIQKEIDTASES